jgi:integrase
LASVRHTPAESHRNPWKVSWWEAGRRRAKRFPTERAAKHFAVDVERGLVSASTLRSSPTMRDWLHTWLTVHGVAWQHSTRVQRASIVDLYLLPYLATDRLHQLDKARVRGWLADLRRAGATPNTVNSARRVLSAALGAAVDDGLRESNPVLGLKPVPQPPPERRPIPVRDVEVIRHALSEPGDRLVVSLLAYAGLRPGELVGLSWGNVRANTLLIDRSVSGRGGGVQRTKTGAVRSVPILVPLREDLSAVQALRDESVPSDPGGGAPVVTGPGGGRLDFHNWSARTWRPTLAKLGKVWVPYEARHTFVSLLISAGHDPAQVAAWAGHSVNVCMSRYTHLFAERQGQPGEDVEATVMRVRMGVVHGSTPQLPL